MEKLKSLTWYWQLLIMIGIGTLLYLSVGYFFTGSTRAETKKTNAKVDELKTKNNTAQIATERIDEFRTLFATKEEEYEELKVLLPEKTEITNVLQGLQDTAKESKLIVKRFTPQDDGQQDFIMAKPVEIEVDSNFNNLRDFFDKMAKLQRIVSITNMNLTQRDEQTAGKTIHAQFLLTAYYASPEDLNDLSAPKYKMGKNGKPVLGKNGKPILLTDKKGKGKKGKGKTPPPAAPPIK